MHQQKPPEPAVARRVPNHVVGRGRPTKLRFALPLLSCRSPLGRGQISVDRRLLPRVHRLKRARDLIVGVLIEQLLESLGIELATRHAKLARAFLRSLKEWSRNRYGRLHSLSITQLYRCGQASNRKSLYAPAPQSGRRGGRSVRPRSGGGGASPLSSAQDRPY